MLMKQAIPETSVSASASSHIRSISAKFRNTSVHFDLAGWIERRICACHLRYVYLPDDRRLLATHEYAAIIQSFVSSSEPERHIPQSQSLLPHERQGTAWLHKALCAARAVDLSLASTAESRRWHELLLGLHQQRFEEAARLLVECKRKQMPEPDCGEVAGLLSDVLNDLLLFDTREIRRFLEKSPQALVEDSLTSFRATADLLVRRRNVYQASEDYPLLLTFVHAGNKDEAKDATGLLGTHLSETSSHPIPRRRLLTAINEIECGRSPKLALAEALSIPQPILHAARGIGISALSVRELIALGSFLQQFPAAQLPRTEADWTFFQQLTGVKGFRAHRKLLSDMQFAELAPADLAAIERWRRSPATLAKSGFFKVANELCAQYRFKIHPHVSLHAFLGRPSYRELGTMMDAWMTIARRIESVHESEAGFSLPRFPELFTGPFTFQGYQFTCIGSAQALVDEGVAMEHCVASRAHFCVRGAAFIVSMCRDGQRQLTIELSVSGDELQVVEVTGHRNREPSANERTVIDQWLEVLNGLEIAHDLVDAADCELHAEVLSGVDDEPTVVWLIRLSQLTARQPELLAICDAAFSPDARRGIAIGELRRLLLAIGAVMP